MVKQKKKTGRRPFEPDDEFIEFVHMAAARGDTIEEIAMQKGIGETSFHKIKNENPKVSEAYLSGRLLSKQKVRRRLMDFIDTGIHDAVSFNATKFWLATQDSWTEKQDVNMTSDGSFANQVVFEIIDSRKDGNSN